MSGDNQQVCRSCLYRSTLTLPPVPRATSRKFARRKRCYGRHYKTADWKLPGLPSLNTPRVAIPAHEWHDLEAIQRRGRDTLRNGSLTGYDKILISRRSVLALWLETQPANETPAFWTGAPGRPTPIHLVVAEHRRRLDSGNAEISVTAEAKHLAGWLKLTHPKVPPLTPKTIQNKIGAGHRAAKNAQN